MKKYRDAVARAVDDLEKQKFLWMEPSNDLPSFAQMWGSVYFQKKSSEGEQDSFYEMPLAAAVELGRLAETHHEPFDLALHICQMNIAARRPVPLGLDDFCLSILGGKLNRPTPSHRESKINFPFYLQVSSELELLCEEFQLSMTRNDVSPQFSACDAVAEALTELGRKTLYHELKNLMVHPSKQELRNRIRAFKTVFDSEREPRNWEQMSKEMRSVAEEGDFPELRAWITTSSTT